MPSFIMKLTDERENKDYYLMWSTIVDAPITWGMALEQFKNWYLRECGKIEELNERLKRADKKGISAH